MEKVEALNNLGLPIAQAKIFVTLALRPKLTVFQISKSIGMPPEQIYRIMPQLIERGLIEKIITTPARFQTIPVETAIKSMLELKEKNLVETRTKAILLLDELELKREAPVAEESSLVMIPTGKRLEEFRFSWKQKLKEKYDLLTTSARFITSLTAQYEKVGVGKNVTMRLILEEEPRLHKAILQILSRLERDINLRYKFCKSQVPAAVAIGDCKEVIISSIIKSPYHSAPLYWTNNPGIVKIMNTYFENLFNEL